MNPPVRQEPPPPPVCTGYAPFMVAILGREPNFRLPSEQARRRRRKGRRS